jgi:hypothetical protein
MNGKRPQPDFSTLVVVGDSSSAGRGVGPRLAYSAVFAENVGLSVGTDERADFVIPGIEPRGIDRGMAAPSTNLGYLRPYHNLSVIGFGVANVLKTHTADDWFGMVIEEAPKDIDPWLARGIRPILEYVNLVLRNDSTFRRNPRTALEQALELKPTTVFLQVQGNDWAKSLVTGGRIAPTPVDSFRAQYAEIVTRLRDTGAHVILLNWQEFDVTTPLHNSLFGDGLYGEKHGEVRLLRPGEWFRADLISATGTPPLLAGGETRLEKTRPLEALPPIDLRAARDLWLKTIAFLLPQPITSMSADEAASLSPEIASSLDAEAVKRLSPGSAAALSPAAAAALSPQVLGYLSAAAAAALSPPAVATMSAEALDAFTPAARQALSPLAAAAGGLRPPVGHRDNPIPDEYWLSLENQEHITEAIKGYRQIIADIGREHGIQVIDLAPLYEQANSIEGTMLGGVRLTRENFVDQNRYPSVLGHRAIAYWITDAINRFYGADLPLPDIDPTREAAVALRE